MGQIFLEKKIDEIVKSLNSYIAEQQVDVSEKYLLGLFSIVTEHNSWFPKHRTLDLATWKKQVECCRKFIITE